MNSFIKGSSRIYSAECQKYTPMTSVYYLDASGNGYSHYDDSNDGWNYDFNKGARNSTSPRA
jgi:hypothetical protein